MAGVSALFAVEGDADFADRCDDESVITRRRRNPALNRSRSVDVDVSTAGRRTNTAGYRSADGGGIIPGNSCFTPKTIGSGNVDGSGKWDAPREQHQRCFGHARGGRSGRKGGKIELHQRLRAVDTTDVERLLRTVVCSRSGYYVGVLSQRDRLRKTGRRQNYAKQKRTQQFEYNSPPLHCMNGLEETGDHR